MWKCGNETQLSHLRNGEEVARATLATVLTDHNLQTVRPPPFPWHVLPSHPPYHRTGLCMWPRPRRTPTATQPEIAWGLWKAAALYCLHIVVLQLKFWAWKWGMAVLSAFVVVDAVRTRSCFASWDGEQSEFRLEAGSGTYLQPENIFAGGWEELWQLLPLPNVSSPESTANFPLCLCVIKM